MRKYLTCLAVFALTGLFVACGPSEDAGTTIVVEEPAVGAELKPAPAPAPVFMESEFEDEEDIELDDDVEVEGDVDLDDDLDMEVDEAQYDIEVDD